MTNTTVERLDNISSFGISNATGTVVQYELSDIVIDVLPGIIGAGLTLIWTTIFLIQSRCSCKLKPAGSHGEGDVTSKFIYLVSFLLVCSLGLAVYGDYEVDRAISGAGARINTVFQTLYDHDRVFREGLVENGLSFLVEDDTFDGGLPLATGRLSSIRDIVKEFKVHRQQFVVWGLGSSAVFVQLLLILLCCDRKQWLGTGFLAYAFLSLEVIWLLLAIHLPLLSIATNQRLGVCAAYPVHSGISTGYELPSVYSQACLVSPSLETVRDSVAQEEQAGYIALHNFLVSLNIIGFDQDKDILVNSLGNQQSEYIEQQILELVQKAKLVLDIYTLTADQNSRMRKMLGKVQSLQSVHLLLVSMTECQYMLSTQIDFQATVCRWASTGSQVMCYSLVAAATFLGMIIIALLVHIRPRSSLRVRVLDQEKAPIELKGAHTEENKFVFKPSKPFKFTFVDDQAQYVYDEEKQEVRVVEPADGGDFLKLKMLGKSEDSNDSSDESEDDSSRDNASTSSSAKPRRLSFGDYAHNDSRRDKDEQDEPAVAVSEDVEKDGESYDGRGQRRHSSSRTRRAQFAGPARRSSGNPGERRMRGPRHRVVEEGILEERRRRHRQRNRRHRPRRGGQHRHSPGRPRQNEQYYYEAEVSEDDPEELRIKIRDRLFKKWSIGN